MDPLNRELGGVGAQAFKTEYLWKARAGYQRILCAPSLT